MTQLAPHASPYARWRGLGLDQVQLHGGFWGARQAIVRDVSLAHGYRMLEQAGNLNNLRLAGGAKGAYQGPVFQDSDVYKWLEAVAYHPPEARAMADEVIGLVQRAQAPDGYLDSYYQVVEPNKRWVDIQMGHELYCAGHLIQAAVAWQRFANDSRLLQVAKRLVEHIMTVFGPGIRDGTPGHPEIELALVELYRTTADRRYLDLAQFFVDQRGHGVLGDNPRFGSSAYYQDRVPVREADEIEGHAVRAMYLTAGVADLYLETGEAALLEALERQWRDFVDRKLYLTGGAGGRHQGEAFGQPYELPNDRAYAETCAAIASIMWSWRMLLATGQAQYADLIERTLFNGFLSGMSLDGERFFYVNPLLSPGRSEVLGRGGHERREWYHVACCPPNVMRLVATLGQYLATYDARGVQIHQYASATVSAGQIELHINTNYPWDGHTTLSVQCTPETPWELRLRVPAWCAEPRVNGHPVLVSDGYIVLERVWREGERVELDLPMPARLTRGHPRVESTIGAVAIERGPLVYCLEECDNADVLDVSLDTGASLQATWQPDLLGGVTTVHAHGYKSMPRPSLYEPFDAPESPARTVRLTAIPYFAWANRAPGAMRVWVPYAH